MTCSQALQPLTRIKMLAPIPQPPNPKISDDPKTENAAILDMIEKRRKEKTIQPVISVVETPKRPYST